jgi:hypothetical protein
MNKVRVQHTSYVRHGTMYDKVGMKVFISQARKK